jgi:hypothetical protein
LAFDNVKGILSIGSPLSSYKLLLMQGMLSRPRYTSLFHVMLQPFVRDERVTLQYRCHDRKLTTFVRASELESDFCSFRELAANDAGQSHFKTLLRVW